MPQNTTSARLIQHEVIGGNATKNTPVSHIFIKKGVKLQSKPACSISMQQCCGGNNLFDDIQNEKTFKTDDDRDQIWRHNRQKEH